MRDVARELAANLAMGVPAIRAARVRTGRTTGASPDAKAREILAQFLFLTGTIGVDGLRGKTVLEIGPGDAIPLALLFLGAGAARYFALDRFLGDVVGGDASALYEATLRRAPPNVLTGLLALGCSVTRRGVAELLGDRDRVTLVDTEIEGDIPIPALGADLVVSFNVCEHLVDSRSGATQHGRPAGGRRTHDSPYRLRTTRYLEAVLEPVDVSDRPNAALAHDVVQPWLSEQGATRAGDGYRPRARTLGCGSH